VGLCTNPAVHSENSTINWETATPKQILDDVNDLINTAWERSGYAVVPDQLRLSPRKFARLVQPVTDAGSMSLLKYISEQCIANAQNGRPLEIHPLKWLTDRGAAGKDRAVVYSRRPEYVRFPLVPLQKTPIEHRGISQLTVYYGKIGQVEFVYPETVAYQDGD
jgi:hypothetical protein